MDENSVAATEGVPDSHQCGKYPEISHFDLFGGAPGAQNDFKIHANPQILDSLLKLLSFC